MQLIGQKQTRTDLGSVSFKVRDFEPDRMKVSLSLHDTPVQGWIPPEQVVAKVTAMHLFGAPAAGRRVTAKMSLSPTLAAFERYPDYRFRLNDSLEEASTEDLALRAGLERHDLQALAAADALAALSGHRRQQMWDAAAQHSAPALLRDVPVLEAPLALPAAPEGEEILFDYAATGLTLRRHPLALLRPRLARWRLQTALQLVATPHGRQVRACGIVTVRQRPGTAKGTMFVTLEDETGHVNVIVWPAMVDRWRNALLRSQLLAVEGLWQCSVPEGGHAHATASGQAPAVVRHLVAQRFKDLTPLLGRMAQALQGSRDFH